MFLTRKFSVALMSGALALTLAGCGTSDADEAEGADGGSETTTIRVGTSPGPYSELFQDGIGPILEDQGYTLEYTNFSELQQADVALSEGSVDLNVDQHTSYMEVFNDETGSDLVAITEIPTVPAGLYSSNHDGLDAVADGQSVGIPQDASNQSRAYTMMADAEWLTLNEDANPALLTSGDIDENPHNLDIQTMDSATIPRSLEDLDWGVIPGSISYSSGVDTELQYLQEDLRPELILVAVARAEDAESEWADAVADAYASEEFAEFLDDENADGYWHVPDLQEQN